MAECRLTPDRAKRHSDDDLLFHIDEVRDGEDCFWEADVADDDAQTFARILEEYPDATDDELISHYREYEKQTAALLEKDEIWGTIEKLARALLERGKLSKDETRPIIYGEQGITSEQIEKIIKVGIQNINNRQ